MNGSPDNAVTAAGEVESCGERVTRERLAIEARKQELKQRIAAKIDLLHSAPVEGEALAADSFELAILEATDNAPAERQRLYEQHLAPRQPPEQQGKLARQDEICYAVSDRGSRVS